MKTKQDYTNLNSKSGINVSKKWKILNFDPLMNALLKDNFTCNELLHMRLINKPGYACEVIVKTDLIHVENELNPEEIFEEMEMQREPWKKNENLRKKGVLKMRETEKNRVVTIKYIIKKKLMKRNRE